MHNDEQRLRAVMLGVFDRRADAVSINPSWLATEAMQELDPQRVAPELVYRAAHLQLRQLARGICRKRFEDGDDDDATGGVLFPELSVTLQARYPAAHSTEAEPHYVRLEHLTEADVRANVQRLRREADAKMAHADALEAWWQSKLAAA